jgi:hypothetical protein
MSGNYQSRVFTFISNRTNQLKDTCTKGLRHLRVAVVWSSQILLYPLHLLAQTSKIFQPQLPSPPQQRSLLQPVSDINIEQALDLVVGSGSPIIITESGSLVFDDTRTAVPKRIAENSLNIERYDPNTDDWEISSYSPRRSPQVTARKPIIRGLSSLLIDRQLVLVTTENGLLNILTISQQQEIRRRIGIDLAINWHQWHTDKLANSYSSQKISANQQLFLTDETLTQQLASDDNSSSSLFDSSKEKLNQRWSNWFQKFNTKSTSKKSSIQEELITSIKPQSPHQLPSADYSFTPQPPTTDRSWEFPQLPPIVENQIAPSQDRPIQDTISKLQPDWLKQWWNYYRDYLYIASKNDGKIVHQPAEFQLIPIEPKPQKIRLKQLQKQQSLREHISSELSVKIHRNLEYNQDWIEADSETIGYSKSPLAKLFAWLDRVLLKIENWLIKIWDTITNRSIKS